MNGGGRALASECVQIKMMKTEKKRKENVEGKKREGNEMKVGRKRRVGHLHPF